MTPPKPDSRPIRPAILPVPAVDPAPVAAGAAEKSPPDTPPRALAPAGAAVALAAAPVILLSPPRALPDQVHTLFRLPARRTNGPAKYSPPSVMARLPQPPIFSAAQANASAIFRTHGHRAS